MRPDPGESKNSEGRMFPLTPELREILARQKTRHLQLATDSVIPLVFDRDEKPIKDYYISAIAWYFCSRCSQAGSSKLLKPGKPASKVRAGGTDLR